MKPFNEIIEAHADGTDIDLEAVLAEGAEEMGEPPHLSPMQMMAMQEQHVDYIVKYVGGVVLEIADQVGALPNGFEHEYKNLELMVKFDKFRRLYAVAMIEAGAEIEGQTKLEVVGEG